MSAFPLSLHQDLPPFDDNRVSAIHQNTALENLELLDSHFSRRNSGCHIDISDLVYLIQLHSVILRQMRTWKGAYRWPTSLSNGGIWYSTSNIVQNLEIFFIDVQFSIPRKLWVYGVERV